MGNATTKLEYEDITAEDTVPVEIKYVTPTTHHHSLTGADVDRIEEKFGDTENATIEPDGRSNGLKVRTYPLLVLPNTNTGRGDVDIIDLDAPAFESSAGHKKPQMTRPLSRSRVSRSPATTTTTTASDVAGGTSDGANGLAVQPPTVKRKPFAVSASLIQSKSDRNFIIGGSVSGGKLSTSPFRRATSARSSISVLSSSSAKKKVFIADDLTAAEDNKPPTTADSAAAVSIDNTTTAGVVAVDEKEEVIEDENCTNKKPPTIMPAKIFSLEQPSNGDDDTNISHRRLSPNYSSPILSPAGHTTPTRHGAYLISPSSPGDTSLEYEGDRVLSPNHLSMETLEELPDEGGDDDQNQAYVHPLSMRIIDDADEQAVIDDLKMVIRSFLPRSPVYKSSYRRAMRGHRSSRTAGGEDDSRQPSAGGGGVEGAATDLPAAFMDHMRRSREVSLGPSRRPSNAHTFSSSSSSAGTAVMTEAALASLNASYGNTPTHSRKPSIVVDSARSDMSTISECSIESFTTTGSDNWDPVTHQPYCKVCQQVFDTTRGLERHFKYSDKHQKLLILRRQSGLSRTFTGSYRRRRSSIFNNKPRRRGSSITSSDEDGGKLDSVDEEEQGELVEHYDEDDEPFRQLYHGAKMFWRTRENVDIHILIHPSKDCIEVVAMDMALDRPTKRLYIDRKKAVSNYEAAMLAEVRQRHTKLVNENRFQSRVPRLADMIEETRRMCLINFILERIEIEPIESVKDSNAPRALLFVAMTMDKADLYAGLDRPPVGMKPAEIELTTTKEKEEKIVTAIEGLRQDADYIQMAIDRAAELSLEIGKSFVNIHG